MGSYWCMEAGTRRWNWNKSPTFRCPNAETWGPPDDIVRRGDQLAEAAAALGADPLRLAQLLTQRHRSGGGLREKKDDRYTGRCRICGARLIKVGYRAWIDDAVPTSKMTDTERASAQVNRRLGFAPPRRPVGEDRHFDTKKAAEQWARAESAKHR